MKRSLISCTFASKLHNSAFYLPYATTTHLPFWMRVNDCNIFILGKPLTWYHTIRYYTIKLWFMGINGSIGRSFWSWIHSLGHINFEVGFKSSLPITICYNLYLHVYTLLMFHAVSQ